MVLAGHHGLRIRAWAAECAISRRLKWYLHAQMCTQREWFPGFRHSTSSIRTDFSTVAEFSLALF